MLCNNYANDLENQPGEQPVRVFYKFYNNIFENIKNELSRKYCHVDLSGIFFYFKTEESKVKSPFCSSFYIQIHDTFLAFLWSYCYGILIKTPMGGKDPNNEELAEADELLSYSLRLLSSYEKWDIDFLPNPELHEKDDIEFIGKSNLIFLVAVNYIVYHEFGHLVLGHIQEINNSYGEKKEVSLERRIEMEKEADTFAFDSIIQSNEFDEFSYLGVLLALCSLTFTSPYFSGGKDHPDPDHRIISFLEKLNLEESHYLWNQSAWALLEWQGAFNSEFGSPENYQSPKQFFYNLITLLDKFKKSL